MIIFCGQFALAVASKPIAAPRQLPAQPLSKFSAKTDELKIG